ncbi:hypothetical protein EVAR_46457_1 [Eumeta japonica]|uniref:Uncharacterized protein n=1 Tax=Eumeta variegata TaxID=151549 RepID=A0A4C1XGS6_EUMVA|nr:hypothetical protein EVAR_46457_1 [Eumeta japonica]
MAHAIKKAEVTRSRPARTWSLCGAATRAHVRRRDAPRDALALTERAVGGALACTNLRPRTRRLNSPPPCP